MQEIWKDIPNYEGLYQVSNLGRVKSTHICKYKKTKILKNIPRNGYVSVILCVNKIHKNVFVHRLVAQCFVPNPKNKPIVNHIDGNKLNCCASNLEWCTQSENIEHAYKNGLLPYKSIYQFDTNGNFIKEWRSVSEAANSLGLKVKNIRNCLYGERKTAYGYVWSKIPNPTIGKIKRRTNKNTTICKSKSTNKRGAKGIPVSQFDLLGNYIKTYASLKEASIQTGISHSYISLCCNRKRKSACGYVWKFKDE